MGYREYRYTVKIRAYGDPAARQRSIIASGLDLEVDSLVDAAAKCKHYIHHWDIGGRNWTGDAGEVTDQRGRVVAKINYNGSISRVERREGMKEQLPERVFNRFMEWADNVNAAGELLTQRWGECIIWRDVLLSFDLSHLSESDTQYISEFTEAIEEELLHL